MLQQHQQLQQQQQQQPQQAAPAMVPQTQEEILQAMHEAYMRAKEEGRARAALLGRTPYECLSWKMRSLVPTDMICVCAKIYMAPSLTARGDSAWLITRFYWGGNGSQEPGVTALGCSPNWEGSYRARGGGSHFVAPNLPINGLAVQQQQQPQPCCSCNSAAAGMKFWEMPAA
eukprot:4750147-Amphidinium_carterae.1